MSYRNDLQQQHHHQQQRHDDSGSGGGERKDGDDACHTGAWRRCAGHSARCCRDPLAARAHRLLRKHCSLQPPGHRSCTVRQPQLATRSCCCSPHTAAAVALSTAAAAASGSRRSVALLPAVYHQQAFHAGDGGPCASVSIAACCCHHRSHAAAAAAASDNAVCVRLPVRRRTVDSYARHCCCAWVALSPLGARQLPSPPTASAVPLLLLAVGLLT